MEINALSNKLDCIFAGLVVGRPQEEYLPIPYFALKTNIPDYSHIKLNSILSLYMCTHIFWVDIDGVGSSSMVPLLYIG